MTVYIVSGRDWRVALVLFAVMEAGNVLGVLWGARLRKRIGRSEDELPLSRRR